ncbi:uncharacterized protein L969DRAFT_49757 [Mixia osmundae IAM 14324]|uniref:DH domain-containing protein n=1 Tax=Mixia osmundae (strain CBS 9802 / IAM 14324 / JCM 22182 / KY 12970) TaxID=764103 RepID=G7E1Y3_MIXOS|nr:uncharacterized protein L969DRAFT_49757 [Mixia osmundae IAM 14324]KEI38645.1 hypothetical protein L969DRAFT_49757 [Mixia osmundae IAM 14324]GAA96896.1 hypothetical protein E5Q_03569 [Mixia osmundae IAM 14324]
MRFDPEDAKMHLWRRRQRSRPVLLPVLASDCTWKEGEEGDHGVWWCSSTRLPCRAVKRSLTIRGYSISLDVQSDDELDEIFQAKPERARQRACLPNKVARSFQRGASKSGTTAKPQLGLAITQESPIYTAMMSSARTPQSPPELHVRMPLTCSNANDRIGSVQVPRAPSRSSTRTAEQERQRSLSNNDAVLLFGRGQTATGRSDLLQQSNRLASRSYTDLRAALDQPASAYRPRKPLPPIPMTQSRAVVIRSSVSRDLPPLPVELPVLPRSRRHYDSLATRLTSAVSHADQIAASRPLLEQGLSGADRAMQAARSPSVTTIRQASTSSTASRATTTSTAATSTRSVKLTNHAAASAIDDMVQALDSILPVYAQDDTVLASSSCSWSSKHPAKLKRRTKSTSSASYRTPTVASSLYSSSDRQSQTTVSPGGPFRHARRLSTLLLTSPEQALATSPERTPRVRKVQNAGLAGSMISATARSTQMHDDCDSLDVTAHAGNANNLAPHRTRSLRCKPDRVRAVLRNSFFLPPAPAVSTGPSGQAALTSAAPLEAAIGFREQTDLPGTVAPQAYADTATIILARRPQDKGSPSPGPQIPCTINGRRRSFLAGLRRTRTASSDPAPPTAALLSSVASEVPSPEIAHESSDVSTAQVQMIPAVAEKYFAAPLSAESTQNPFERGSLSSIAPAQRPYVLGALMCIKDDQDFAEAVEQLGQKFAINETPDVDDWRMHMRVLFVLRELRESERTYAMHLNSMIKLLDSNTAALNDAAEHVQIDSEDAVLLDQCKFLRQYLAPLHRVSVRFSRLLAANPTASGAAGALFASQAELQTAYNVWSHVAEEAMQAARSVTFHTATTLGERSGTHVAGRNNSKRLSKLTSVLSPRARSRRYEKIGATAGLSRLAMTDVVIMPIQRITRLALFYKELRALLGPDDEAAAVLQEALVAARSLASICNEARHSLSRPSSTQSTH